jgi:hypothetical protein
MADEDKQEEGKRKLPLVKILLLVVLVLLVLVGAIGATLFLTGYFDQKDEQTAEAQLSQASQQAKQGGPAGSGGAGAGGETWCGERRACLSRGGQELVDCGGRAVQPHEVLRHILDEGHVACALGRRGVEDGRAGRRDRVHHAQGALQQSEGEEDQLVGLAVGGGGAR